MRVSNTNVIFTALYVMIVRFVNRLGAMIDGIAERLAALSSSRL